jgi:tetratricopeptide (TPR) repeat protein
MAAADSSLREVLADLRRRNDWRAIRDLFAPIEELDQGHPSWEDAWLLSEVAFACAKLSETSANDLRGLAGERERRFLEQQSNFRTEAVRLRQRCIELAPERPGYRSDLAYLHFKNAQELTEPRGRRDGNARDEASRALELYESALEKDPNRVQDLYRAGYILTEMSPRLARLTARNASDLAGAGTRKAEGLELLSRAIAVWEGLAADDKSRQRWRKEYVKSLYHAGKCEFEMVNGDWDETGYALDLRSSQDDGRRSIPQNQLRHLNKAWESFNRCWKYDRDADPQPGANPPFDGVFEAVEKLYWLGKIKLAEYWVRSDGGQDDTPLANRARERAQTCLERALAVPRPPSNQRQRKDYIVERLARLFITRGEFTTASALIERHCGTPNRLDPYIANTLGLCLDRQGRSEEAREVLGTAVRARSNRGVWTSHFLLGCTFLRSGLLLEARQQFTLADEKAKAFGKQSFDSCLIGQAFVEYKLGERTRALEFLREALRINPYRSSAQRHLEQWLRDLPQE